MSTTLPRAAALAFACAFAVPPANAQQLTYEVLSLDCKKDLGETTYEECSLSIAVRVSGYPGNFAASVACSAELEAFDAKSKPYKEDTSNLFVVYGHRTGVATTQLYRRLWAVFYAPIIRVRLKSATCHPA